MRGRVRLTLVGAVLISTPLAAPSVAAQSGAVEVGANGNPFTGGLSFTPERAVGPVGSLVRWTNTDPFVPHTATEMHGLFDLGGDYGVAAISPTGFGPGESVERRFSAGTFDYFCRVHPTMLGVVAIPVRLFARHGRGGRYVINAVWALEKPAEGQVFDVQRRVGGGWRMARKGTRSLRGGFRTRPGKVVRFRARLRRSSDGAASRYSPVSRVRIPR